MKPEENQELRNSGKTGDVGSSSFPDFLSSKLDLPDFLARHVKPYDPTTDDYDRPPFAADIKEGKNDPIYNAHSYHTKVPPRGIIPYILQYTEPGDLVLDPFCGSGMAGVAAQMCANPPADILEQFSELKDRVGPRACILNDLSPAACHIAYNYNTPVDVDALKREFERIKAAVKEEFDWLYRTEHYEPAVGLYDPVNPEVASRLKNPPANAGSSTLLGDEERTWELLTMAQVEERLGYPVTELPRAKDWGDLDVAKVKNWVCIPATIQYTIWSDVYRCEGLITIEEPTGRISTRGKNAGKPILSRKRVARGCGKDIVLWEAAIDHESGAVTELFACPYCEVKWKKMQLRRQDNVPVAVNLASLGLKRTKRGCEPVRLRYQRKVTALELWKLSEIAQKSLPYWVPDTPMDTRGPQYRRNALQVRKIEKVTDFWSTRNLWAYASLRWFSREGTRMTPRYSHGGLSMAEVVVPGVVLRRITEKTARAELLDLPTVLHAEEDAVVELPFDVRNTGNGEIEFEVRAVNNLGQELFQHRAHLAPAVSAKLTAPVTAKYRETPAREPDPTGTVSAVTLRLRHTDLDGTWRDALDGRVSIPVKIKPKAVKFDTDALKGFDDV